LAAGQAIGSGLIEGACKNLVGRRMKQTGACWRLERANRIALVCSLLYAKQWDTLWKNAN
ncbi:MAG: ISKra4 family transposase, partial [Planctomycetaceae bacterium]|nr:ISKra4 family transposase [Planctomycetaceae bacterium]